MDNNVPAVIYIMSLLNMNSVKSTYIFVFVIINGNKHVQTYG